MRRRVLSVACRASELEQRLAESVAALEGGARFVDPAVLLPEAALHALHAKLWRGVREQRVYTVPPEPLSLVVNPDDLPFE